MRYCHSSFANKLLALLCMVLVSCNLFVEDVAEEDDFKDVPVHTGKGYDAPITINDGSSEVTYQYNSCVRVLSQDIQDRWIVSVESDPVGAFVEIHYSTATPKDQLPVAGEILVSTVTDKFPWGCDHQVQYRVDEDGVYKYIATSSTLEETYKVLDINGNITTTENEEVYEIVDGDVTEEEVQDYETTRAKRNVEDNGGGDNDDLVGVKFENESSTIDIHFSHYATMTLPKGITASFVMPKEKNYTKVTTTFNFENFSLSEGRYKAKITQTFDEMTYFEIKGGWSAKDKRIKRWRPVKGKAFVCGPVVLVFFVNLDLNIDLTLEGSASFSKHKITSTTYDIDFKSMRLEKKTEDILSEDWKPSNLSVTASVGVYVKMHIGLGIYGKIISVRVVPKLRASLEATVPLIQHDEAGNDINDISGSAGLTTKVDLTVDVGVFLDLSLRQILGRIKTTGTDAHKALLKELEADAKKSSDYYQGVVNSDNAEYDPNKKYYKNGKERQEGEDEIGISHTFGPWTVWGPKFKPWFPKIKDNSLKVVGEWNAQKQKMEFHGEFAIKDVGFFAGFGRLYTPALQINKGSQYVTTIFPEEGGVGTVAKSGKTYHFTIADTKNDVQYTATPCYFGQPVSRSAPDALDKGVVFCATSPSISVFMAKPKNMEVDYRGDGYDFDHSYRYHYTFYVDTSVSLRGASNVRTWSVTEAQHDTEMGSRAFEQKKDGTYIVHWVFDLYAKNGDTKTIRLQFVPWFKPVGSDQLDQPIFGEEYMITLDTDRKCVYIDPDTGKPLSVIDF